VREVDHPAPRALPVHPAARARRAVALALATIATLAPTSGHAGQEGSAPEAPQRPRPRTFEVSEYRLRGSTLLPGDEAEAALAPYLGPGQTLETVERARAALEKAYSQAGWQAVTVAIPQQTVRDGVVLLDVTETKVSRLRVRGAQWFLPSEVRALAPSMAEGTSPNFKAVVRDIFELNQLPDRRVMPIVRAGTVPGTMEVDLDVEDHLPLHGSLELNDRASAFTTPLRLNGALRYDNLFQLGHSLALSFQTSPERPEDARVFAASYLARFPELSWLTLNATGIVQDSDVSTLGGVAVLGRGRIFGARATVTLPAPIGWFHTLSVGADRKEFEERVGLGKDALEAPVTYWPATAQYAASSQEEGAQTLLSASVSFNLRAASSGPTAFDTKRYLASGNFVVVRGDAARVDDLLGGLQLSERVAGQWTRDPLIGSEQFTVGGVETVRGYLEATAVGDLGAAGQLELRSPTVTRWWKSRWLDEWRFHAFTDAGVAWLHQPLPEQRSEFALWSVGAGTRFRARHLSGGLDVGVALKDAGTAVRHPMRIQFRVASEF
jgi:hemolysin activation/secretion protein